MSDADKLQAAEARIAELSSHIARLEELKSGQIGATIRRGHEAEDVRLCGETVLASTELIARMFEDSFTLRAQLAAMERRAEEWQLRATFGSIEDEDDLSLHDRQVHDALLRQRDLARHQLAAAAEEAARLRKALDLAGRKISGAALHQMHEHAEAEVREALRSMSDTLNATPSTGEAVREAWEQVGRVADALDNFSAGLELPLPDALHLEALNEALPKLRDKLRAAVVAGTGDNPWQDE